MADNKEVKQITENSKNVPDVIPTGFEFKTSTGEPLTFKPSDFSTISKIYRRQPESKEQEK